MRFLMNACPQYKLKKHVKSAARFVHSENVRIVNLDTCMMISLMLVLVYVEMELLLKMKNVIQKMKIVRIVN